ncbi:hypothetical protein BY458DRAFT_546126 [Sporodiniella umbellata]|nr:hypothetical protein BY458DRAFT_546126 [Sporodiniella umbellata]
MMTEENNVGPLATPTRFLYENNQWNLTPNLTNEINPFECHFQPMLKETPISKWSPLSVSSKDDSSLSPSTPPMTLSPTPTSVSPSLTITPRHSMAEIETQPLHRKRASKRARRDSLEDHDYKPKTGHGGRKRCIVFDGEDAEERRKKFLERNRQAAYKCRQKKKSWMKDLEEKADLSAARNEELRQTVSQLKEESMYLRNLLLSHGNCECESVQAYLRKTSEQITFNAYREDSQGSYILPNTYYSSTGLTPFLNTVINKTSSGRTSNSTEANDYFSQAHMA